MGCRRRNGGLTGISYHKTSHPGLVSDLHYDHTRKHSIPDRFLLDPSRVTATGSAASFPPQQRLKYSQ